MGAVDRGASMGAVTEDDRAPKQDRSRVTRQRLLEAAVACLAEHGWAGSTVSVVAERAGVSRGAAQHHFRTREELFTAAVEYVAEERSAALRGLFPEGAAAGADRTAVVAALVDLYTGPLFRAALQLWVAASNEAQLGPRVAELEARVGRETHRIAVELLGSVEEKNTTAVGIYLAAASVLTIVAVLFAKETRATSLRHDRVVRGAHR